MEVKVYEGKELESILENIKEDLKVDENAFLYKVENKKGGLLKKTSLSVSVYLLKEVEEYAKEILKNLTKLMGIDCQFEAKIRDNQITIKMFSDKNSLLIGKEGRTLNSLTTIIRQAIYNQINIYPNIYLDVENYKEKQEKRIERLAKNLARDVVRTGVEVKMDNMNAYERRIVHNALSENSKVTTISEGEEPNRHVIIKLKEE